MIFSFSLGSNHKFISLFPLLSTVTLYFLPNKSEMGKNKKKWKEYKYHIKDMIKYIMINS